MPKWLDDLGVYALLALMWIGVPGWIAYRLWQRRSPGRMKAEPVESNLPRVRREPVTQIDAEPGRDYRGPGRKGEPFFTIEGIEFLVWFAISTALSIWLTDLFQPLVDWLVPRSPR